MKRLRDILEKNETVIYKTPERAAPPPKNWVQSMFKITAGEPVPEPVKPLPQFDKTQSAMPDMDTMVAKEKQPVKISDAGVRKTTNAFTSTINPEPKVASLVAPQSGYPAANKTTLAPAENQKASSGKLYKIQDKDNPTKIAKKLGISLDDLEKKNPGLIKRAKRLKIGDSLNI
jgi:hypothetical protein